jgi:Na+/alanine symporter
LGITGSYAGQLFGLLVGFGTAMLKKSLLEKRSVPFPLFSHWEENILDIFVIFIGFTTLVTTFVYASCNKMKYDSKFGKILMAYYVIFVIVATILACKAAYF